MRARSRSRNLEVSNGRRGGGAGEPAPHPVPPEAGGSMLVDSRGLAQLLGIGRTNAYQLMLRGEVPTIRIGRCVRVPRDGLAEWIRENTAASLSDSRLPH